MKIDVLTSQEELMELFRRAVRRDVLKSTPLNLRMFLRYLVLFVLFPGMVMGFRAGLIVTMCFCGVLTAIMLVGTQGMAEIAIWSWLSLGMMVLAYVQARVIHRARMERRLRCKFRPAQAGLKRAVCEPQHEELRWRKDTATGQYVARLHLEAPERGVYALLLSMSQYDKRQLIAGGVQGTCIVQATGKPGADFHALILYRLNAGQHELVWTTKITPDNKFPRPLMVSQLNRVEA